MTGMIALNHKRKFNSMILIACIISFAFVSFIHDTAQASVKHLLIGGLVGAGAVIAWPTITAAVTSLAGGVVAAGTAAAGAVAVGGAAVGGAVAGAGAAVGGAVTAGFGAIGGAVAAITASPLFLPILAAVGIAVVGVVLYKHFKKKRIESDATVTSNTIGDSTSGRITDSTATTVTDKNGTTPSTTNVVVDKNTTATDTSTSQPATSTSTNTTYQDNSAQAMKDRYSSAYKNYVNLLQADTSNGTSAEITAAFQKLKDAQEEYKNYLAEHPETSK